MSANMYEHSDAYDMMQKEIITDLRLLDFYLQKVAAIFFSRDIFVRKINHDSIINYYRKSGALYQYVHSYKGAVHLALNYDGVFHKEGYYAQAGEILDCLKALPVANVLELGCGKGFNSIFLARKMPDIHFCGIDITDKHLAVAHKKSRSIKNITFSYGDFQSLGFENEVFDLIFELEAVCHAQDSRQVLSEIYRTLKKGGRFIQYDGFRLSGFDGLSEPLRQAAILVEKSLAVDRFEIIDSWLDMAAQTGFKIKEKKDLSSAVMPTLGKLQLLARKYFEYPLLSKLFLKILPREMMMNTIAVLLMPFTMQHNAHGYYKIVLEK